MNSGQGSKIRIDLLQAAHGRAHDPSGDARQHRPFPLGTQLAFEPPPGRHRDKRSRRGDHTVRFFCEKFTKC